jgi:hypothetical protein
MDIAELSDRLARLERQQEIAETHFGAAFWRTLDELYAITLPDRVLRCIVCSREASWSGWEKLVDQCMFGGGRLERYRCPSCDCVFGPQKYLDLDDAFVDGDYRLLYSRYAESDSTEDEIRTFKSLDPQPGQLHLDWGCGGSWSQTIDRLRIEGHDVWGYEPSADAATSFVVNRRDAISARFRGIFSNNVIEHFRDPVAQFADFHNILTDDGTMAHSSPCYQLSYTNTRFHTLFLLGNSPHVLAERTGFAVGKSERDGEYCNFVFEKRSTPR